MTTPFDRRILWLHWEGEAVREVSIEALADNIRRETPNVAGVVVKTSNGARWQGALDQRRALAIDGPGDIQRWVHVLSERRLETHLWCVVQGQDIARESDLIITACHTPGVRSMLLDVESGANYFGGRSAQDARSLIARVRAAIPPEFHLGLIFDYRGSEPTRIHMPAWIPHVQSLHPMVYHWEYGGGRQGPEVCLNEAFGALVRYGLPVVPMLQTYPTPEPVPEDQVYYAGEYAMKKGAAGLTFFRYGADASAPPILAGIRRLESRWPADYAHPAKRVFQVRALRLNVRAQPGRDSAVMGFLPAGTILEVDAASRTEAGGYVWWCGDQGWVAQGRADYRHVLMIEITPAAPPHGLPLTDAPLPEIEQPTPDVPQKRFRVIAPAVSVRSQPVLSREFLSGADLQHGTEIVVDADAWTEKDGFRWWAHGSGWSAETALASGLSFMEDLTPEVAPVSAPPIEEPEAEIVAAGEIEPAPSPAPAVPLKRFRVIARLKVRSQPGLGQQGINAVLNAGVVIESRADSWREVDGYVWWQHGTGWSAERSLDGRQRFMQDLTPDIPRADPDTPKPPPVPVPPPAPAPLPDMPQRYRVVALGVTIRDEPNTNAIRTGRLRQGEELLIDPGKVVESDGYVWVRHSDGWSAVRSLDGKEELMLNIDTLPLLGALFQRLPVRIEETEWVQYYGNTSFAYRHGRLHSYHKFSQGLHSGLDFGKFTRNPTNPTIFAGVDGLFDGRGLKYGPNRVDVLVGDYRIIFGHVGSPCRLPRRTPIKPDTVMGLIENTQLHLHLEVRYRDRYILNPLLFMPPAMADAFISKFPPAANTFVQTGSWNRWLTPLDQPVIRLGGEVIGPTA
ncbi:MAG TPA: SH3 domain-containing protein [Spirillospora sp.]|nr:SH3 domain-containing protein [Spirillospora sp.]